MVGRREHSVQTIFVVILAVLISSSHCLRVRFITGELKRLPPLVIKKFSQISPVYINIRSEDKSLTRDLVNSLHAKPPTKRSIITKPQQSSRKHRRSLFSVPKFSLVPYILPWIPKTPLLPIFPSFVPPSPPGPIKPPLTTMPNIFDWDKAEPGVLEKLIRLRQRGTLTTEEYLKFKYLLLKK